MGFCCSRPEADDADVERTALLGEYAESVHEPETPDRFANLSPDEIARVKEEERLKALEQRTTDSLINISHHTAFAHGLPLGGSGQHSRDYTEVLRRFNEDVRLQMVTLSGVVVDRRQPAGNADVVAVLTGGRIPDADAELLDRAICRVGDIISAVHIDPPPGDCIVSLSISSSGL
ncbi:hypothetical protein H4R18_000969 [Coemansia javaensis]|uniref:Uncharacterized protein n=1 Tax=Coemansia javaensis TaxID=2761396 RepID=A0A9W8HGG4_9FUNG|nr:hypothetical protein H4R18_000969 [Coemansia javaensis]